MYTRTTLGLAAATLLVSVLPAAHADMPAQPAGAGDEVRATVAQMLADAETRSSLLSAGDAGHDGKFFLAGDGFRLNVGGYLQFRYVLNFRDDSNVDDFQSGFQARRTRLVFDGKINRDWDFRIMTDFSRSSGDQELKDAYVRYNFPTGWKLKWGQFKLPLLREELVPDTFQLAADRSITNQAFTQERSQGVELEREFESWRFAVAFSDGLNSQNTDFTGSGEDTSKFKVKGEADWAVTGRADFLFAGNWGQFKDFTSPRGSDFAAMLGVAAHYQQSENTRTPADVDRDTLQYTADLSLKGDGWNAFGAFIGRYSKLKSLGGADPDFNDFGVVVQGGVRVGENSELFARWDALFFDSDRNLADDNFNFLTAGYNHYFAAHAAKFTLDAVYAFEKTGPLTSLGILKDTGVGLLGDTEDGEVVVRGQFQLMF